jgi:hypothetical protein
MLIEIRIPVRSRAHRDVNEAGDFLDTLYIPFLSIKSETRKLVPKKFKPVVTFSDQNDGYRYLSTVRRDCPDFFLNRAKKSDQSLFHASTKTLISWVCTPQL